MSSASVKAESIPEVIYRSHVQVQAGTGGIKYISLPFEAEPVPMGMNGAIAAHYKMPEGAYTPRASTLDYIVGATAGCLTGTLNRALQVRKIATDAGRLRIEAIGDIEVEDGVLVIRRIKMLVQLRAAASLREAADRAIAVYATQCPVYRSLYKAIDITTEFEFEAENGIANI